MGIRAERRFGMDSRADEQKMAILARKRRSDISTQNRLIHD